MITPPEIWLSDPMDYSPALSDGMSDEELDAYFASYVPLSNLPTPPPPSKPVCCGDRLGLGTRKNVVAGEVSVALDPQFAG